MSLWNSVELLNKTNSYLVVSFVIISLLFGLMIWKVQSRITELSGIEQKKLQEKIDSTELKANTFEAKYTESEQKRVYAENEFQTQLEQANKSILSAHKKIEPRLLQQKQIEIIIPALKQLQGIKVKISYASGIDEERKFAESIIKALSGSGIQYEDGSANMINYPYGSGLNIIVNNTPPERQEYVILQQAFQQAGIKSEWIDNPKFKRDSIWFSIGKKQ